MALVITNVLPLPAGGYGARCTCGWFVEGPFPSEDEINQVVKEHAGAHRTSNGDSTSTVLA